MKLTFATAFLLIVFSTHVLSQTTGDEILGEWISSKKDSRILIYKKDNEKFFGKITWGTGGPPNDEKNPDPKLRQQQLIGLDILKNFVFDEDEWNDGTIYDPREGKTYTCRMTLGDKGELNIRGYVGIALFGRTEIWTRFNKSTK